MTYSSRPPGKQRQNKPKKDFGPVVMVAISLVILVLCGVGYTLYEIKAHPNVGANFTSYTTKVKQWLADRRQRFDQGLANVKTAANTREDVQPAVQFEFYNKLPEMQMMQASAEKQIEKTIAAKAAELSLEPKPRVVQQVTKKLAKTTVETKEAVKPKVVAQMMPTVKKNKVAKRKPVKKAKIAKRNVKHKVTRTHVAKKHVKKRVARKTRPVKRRVAKKKVKIVVSRAADLEKDLLATIKNTAGGK